jgi:hypothetical protein
VVGDAVGEMTDTLNKWKNWFGRGRQRLSGRRQESLGMSVTSLFVPSFGWIYRQSLITWNCYITWRQPTCHTIQIDGRQVESYRSWPVRQNPLLLKNATTCFWANVMY